jgi:hypothetical protein
MCFLQFFLHFVLNDPLRGVLYLYASWGEFQ